MSSKALVILSGGQDSTTALFWALGQFEEVHAITFDYGQRHVIEVECAKRIAKMAGVASHEVLNVAGILVGSPLLNHDEELQAYSDKSTVAEDLHGKPRKTFVPARNQLFITIAANRAYALGCNAVVIGACGTDANGYPDATEVFLQSIEAALWKGTFVDRRFHIWAPLIYLDKAESVKLAKQLPGCMDALAYSHTAYDGKYPPTGDDHASVTRANGFEEAGEPDPLVVRAWREGLMQLPETSNYDRLRRE